MSKEELIDTFWNSQSSSNPINALKTLIHRIRTQLNEYFGEGVNKQMRR